MTHPLWRGYRCILVSAHCDVTLFVIRHRTTSRNVLTCGLNIRKVKHKTHGTLLLNDFNN